MYTSHVDFKKHRGILQAYNNDMYLHIVIFCQCGRVHYTQWHDNLATHEVQRGRCGRLSVQFYSTSELEQKCCPDIATPDGIEFYYVNVEHALTCSDVHYDPVLLTTFTCDKCEEKHLILLDGRHRLYRAVVEDVASLPTVLLPEEYYKGFTCLVRDVVTTE